ncbi:uncharacterized protein [Diadema antillarum]|uniref:uncharacterized protein n=1 Tax=Diadema antillarum TaxID=105358 RepID=UPI003A8AD63B
MEDKQRLVEDPPSYVTSEVPVNTLQQTGTNIPVYQPQPGYTIQNVAGPAQAPGCCDCCMGRSDRFSIMSGRFTGLIQLISAILIAGLFAAAIVVSEEGFYAEYPGFCADIAGAVILFLPAGIIGVCTKNKGSCAIVAYLVMSILAAIQGVYVALVQGSAAAWYSFHNVCPDYSDVVYPSSEFENGRIVDVGWGSCMYQLNVCLVVIHSLSALLGFVVFIAAVVGAAFSCKGLTCCCSGQQQQQPAQTVLVYAYGSAPIAAPTQDSSPDASKA